MAGRSKHECFVSPTVLKPLPWHHTSVPNSGDPPPLRTLCMLRGPELWPDCTGVVKDIPVLPGSSVSAVFPH